MTEQGVGIVALDAGIDTSEANPAARLQIAMMLAFAEWERQTVRERSIAGQIRAREAGKIIGRAEALTESAKPDIRLLHQQGQSATRLAEDYRVARSTIYKAIAGGETREYLNGSLRNNDCVETGRGSPHDHRGLVNA